MGKYLDEFWRWSFEVSSDSIVACYDDPDGPYQFVNFMIEDIPDLVRALDDVNRYIERQGAADE